MLRPAALHSLPVVVTLTSWLEALSPYAVGEYVFNGYDYLLTHLAMERLRDEDFPKPLRAAVGETDTLTNLRAALNLLYPGSTLHISNEQNKLRLAITVPGGAADTWPAQIAQPGPITYPTVGALPHEVK